MDKGDGSPAEDRAGSPPGAISCSISPTTTRRSTASTNRFAYMQGVNVLPQQPLSLMKQSNDTTHADIAIPAPVRKLYASYRPTLLRRAKALEERLGTVRGFISNSKGQRFRQPQAQHRARAGLLLAEGRGEAPDHRHGAGRWGTASLMPAAIGLACTVFMVGISYRQKPQRRTIVELFRARSMEPERSDARGRERGSATQTGSARWRWPPAGDRARPTSDGRAQFAVGGGELRVARQTVIGNEAVGQMDASATSGLCRGLHGGRQQFRRGRHAVPPRRRRCAGESPTGGGRAAGLPEDGARRLSLRHQRFFRHDAGHAHVQAGRLLPRPAVRAGRLRCHGASALLSAL